MVVLPRLGRWDRGPGGRPFHPIPERRRRVHGIRLRQAATMCRGAARQKITALVNKQARLLHAAKKVPIRVRLIAAIIPMARSTPPPGNGKTHLPKPSPEEAIHEQKSLHVNLSSWGICPKVIMRHYLPSLMRRRYFYLATAGGPGQRSKQSGMLRHRR
jgi:hypothetical protein